ncbi:succinyl-CoA synthetase-like protein [Trichodelitschia bisporula]|uniref:Succinyl-CoA synthetase-like protein n=1 Tax=Trichodelitschia bisporula TaxID=703511 RepID=A0A6G1IAQ2_9PEZI|nr:succinyl-CoA synthetase-like protein [Trichodelitschia bisporula]
MLRTLPRSPRPHTRLFSSRRTSPYESTIANLNIGAHTRVIFQGFTGKQATANAIESLAWGTNIVGGVRPGKEGEHLGLPVLPSVRRAMAELKPDATGIYVAAHQAPAAIEEAIEAEVPLIVAVAEHIPLHDILRIHSILQTQSKSRLVGANSPGIISALGKCRIGFQPLPTFSPGHVGIIAKSGTLSYETVAALTRQGVGQSLCIGMGGDVVAGTDFVDGLRVFEHDTDTHAIILVGEVGGTAEEEAAEWIKAYRARTPNPKPIAGLVGGRTARPGTVMGHAGAWAGPGQASAAEKQRVLEEAGVVMVDHPTKFGGLMKTLLAQRGAPTSASSGGGSGTIPAQARGFHTLRRPHVRPAPVMQKRSLHLRADQAATLLAEHGIRTSALPAGTPPRSLVLTIDRTMRSPVLIASSGTGPATHTPFSYAGGPSPSEAMAAVRALDLDTATPAAADALELIVALWGLFRQYEGIELRSQVGVAAGKLLVAEPEFTFDDAAFRSSGRHAELHGQRDVTGVDPMELAGEAAGIVYVKLDGEDRNIGTVVNGAGLAMNTVDALEAQVGGLATNFLDTGGKATSETVKRSFELVLADPRVKVVFVNIFGGLTLGDMIARGVVMAMRELEVHVPVVVRIRGTREEEGQAVIRESGLKVFAYDGFEEAARKVVELANRS